MYFSKLLFFVAVASAATAAGAQIVSQEVVATQRAQVMQLDAQAAQPAGVLEQAPAGYKLPQAMLAATQQVAYRRPAGSFYAGMSTKTNLKTCPYIIASPFRVNTWENVSQNIPESYAWKWNEIVMNYKGTDDTLTVEGRNLDQYYLLQYDRVPTLMAVDGTDTLAYTLHSSYGSKTYYSDVVAAPNPNSILGLFGSYGSWLSSSKYFGYYDRLGKYQQAITHYSVAGDASTSSWFGKNAKGNTNACATAFEKPANPYILTKVNAIFCNAKFTKPVTLHAAVYRLKDIPDTAHAVPTPVELIAKGEAELNEDAILYESGRWGALEFPLKAVYKGQQYDVTPEINFPILVVVGGYDNENISQFTLVVSRDETDDGYGELGYLCNIDTLGNLIDARGFLGNWKSLVLHSAPSIFIQTMHTYLKVYNDEKNALNTADDLTYQAPAQGGEKDVELYSYMQSSGLWTVTDADTGGSLPQWLKVQLTDSTSGNNYTGHTGMHVTVDALPAGITARQARIRLWYPGSELVYTVTQDGGTGVHAIDMQGSRARVVGGDFAIEATQATSVDIFNLAGQLVKSASLPQGTSVIDGQNLGRGVYLVRFASGTTVKVMK